MICIPYESLNQITFLFRKLWFETQDVVEVPVEAPVEALVGMLVVLGEVLVKLPLEERLTFL
jgi:hypothetical protein